jgi:5-formyltetrahydrofolate cyclo-ligase
MLTFVHADDFAEFIADFQGSSEATAHFTALPCYKDAKFIFITPDNCLEELRLQTLRDGKTFLVTTYSIRRGFWILDPADIPESRYEYACTLDGMERVARQVSLSDLLDMSPKIDLMITGTGAINTKGIRYGKGHGFFDLEWAMLFTLGLVDNDTTTVAMVHDCQVLSQELHPAEFDTVCDLVVTPTRVIEVDGAQKPRCGILWNMLEKNMLEDIPPLRELKELIRQGDIEQP